MMNGKVGCRDFTKIKSVVDLPDLLEVQTQSYNNFLRVELPKLFRETFPISDLHNRYSLEYVSLQLGVPKYTPEEAQAKGTTYATPLKVLFRLMCKEPDGKLRVAIENDVYLCDLPLMTEQGTFIINGVERVVVSQLHRAPGIYFNFEKDTYSAMLIPYRGQWLEFIIDTSGTFYAILDRRRRLLGSMFLRSLGYEKNEDIFKLFFPVKNVNLNDADGFFLAQDLQWDKETISAGELITEELIGSLKNKGIGKVLIVDSQSPAVVVLVNTMRKDRTTKQEDAARKIYTLLRSMSAPTYEIALNYINSMLFDTKRFDLGSVGRFKVNELTRLKVDKNDTQLKREDLIELIRLLLRFYTGEIPADDIDHLGNRRVRRVGELLENQFRIALTQLAQSIKERASLLDEESLTPQDLINPRLVSNLITKFFTTSQLSQFMEQVNPLAEMTHKRRLSAMGPGGLTRETAGFEVRDVHYTHYSRICPIETPEGPNIGLISTLANYARIDELGFISAPYRKVKNSRVTNEVVFLRADQEDQFTIAQANTPIEEDGSFKTDRVLCRRRGDFPIVHPREIDFMDVSPKQVVSPAAALIPFLEHDDANRALMGSNMQRQAVPLINPDVPVVATGLEAKVAHDSGVLVLAQEDGMVDYLDSERIVIRKDDGQRHEYRLMKFRRSNQNTCIDQKPLVQLSMRVKRGQVLADGYATRHGEIALGKNVLVAFLPMRGFNFEDAVVINERLVRDDTFTSLHILEFTCEVRETKLGPEEITRDVPGVGEALLRNLDEDGIIRIGAEVEPDDILVGKITPKGESELSPEERLLKAIFAEKAANVRDTSLRAEPGVYGVVSDRVVLTRKTPDKLATRIEKERVERLKKEFTKVLSEILTERNNLLKQYLLNRHAASTIRDGRGRVQIKRDQVFSERYFDSLFQASKNLIEKLEAEAGFSDRWVDAIKAVDIFCDENFVEDNEIDKKVKTLVEQFKKRLDEIEASRKNEFDKIQKGDELPHGVLKIVKVYIIEKRKISVGDKVAGRHGNKGVVAKIMPEEDMPYLADGRTIDIVLNPLGVPSRMNVGQILETHLGWAMAVQNLKAISPVFEGATVDEVKAELKKAGLPVDGKIVLY
ncbi:MAG: DNA-directed RNA polymerase subunit beta, partial [candidate division WOR-3 bacterium]